MFGEKAVDEVIVQDFFEAGVRREPRRAVLVDAPSSLPSLDRGRGGRENAPAPQHQFRAVLVPNPVHHFEESIGGRAYLIEVAPIGPGRWRADLARVPGVPTALMPFYGRTPDEAARLLTDWLSRAHRRMGATSSG